MITKLDDVLAGLANLTSKQLEFIRDNMEPTENALSNLFSELGVEGGYTTEYGTVDEVVSQIKTRIGGILSQRATRI